MSMGVTLAYLFTFLSVILCVVYGIINWNKGGDEELTDADIRWVEEESKIEKEFE